MYGEGNSETERKRVIIGFWFPRYCVGTRIPDFPPSPFSFVHSHPSDIMRYRPCRNWITLVAALQGFALLPACGHSPKRRCPRCIPLAARWCIPRGLGRRRRHRVPASERRHRFNHGRDPSRRDRLLCIASRLAFAPRRDRRSASGDRDLPSREGPQGNAPFRASTGYLYNPALQQRVDTDCSRRDQQGTALRDNHRTCTTLTWRTTMNAEKFLLKAGIFFCFEFHRRGTGVWLAGGRACRVLL